MPRRATLTGRVERLRNRSILNVVSSRVQDEADDMIDVLEDSYKCALNVVPCTFHSSYLGSLEMCCLFCSAKHFRSEVTLRNTQTFTLCCHKGKVVLPSPTQNLFFKQLWEGLSSNDISLKNRSKNYFQNIRSYNSSFAMVSSETKLSENILPAFSFSEKKCNISCPLFS